MRRFVPALSAAALTLWAVAAAAAPPPAHLAELAETVQSLVDAYERIAGESAADRAYQAAAAEQVRQDLATAREHLVRGRLAAAQPLLHEAYQEATQLVIDMRSGSTQVSRRQDQYVVGQEARAERDAALVEASIRTVGSLTDAYRAAAREKGLLDQVRLAEVNRHIEAAQANLLLSHLPEARREVGEAAETIGTLVIGVRQGDTLVKRLVFETPADEYRYEMDRVISYRMLVRLAMAEDGTTATLRAAERAEADALLLTERAGDEARKDNWGDAIRLLENANSILAAALRGTGRWIPG